MEPERDPTGGPPPRKPRRGDVLEARLLGHDRRGRARGEARDAHGRSFVALLPRGVPGDRWRGEVARRRGDQLELRPLELLEGGPDRVPARCVHVASCGGCSFQELGYPAQLAAKHAALRALLDARPALAGLELAPVVGDATGFAYRNKMEFTFAARRWIEPDEPQGVESGFALGLHPRGRFDKVIDLTGCAIVFEGAEAILASARELARARGLTPWDVHAHTGLLRHLVLRHGAATGEVLVHLVTSEDAPEAVDPYAAELLARHPEITTFVHGVNTRPAAIAVAERERVLHGPGWIRERLLGLEFRVSAGSFFQTNTRQAERLFAIVREEAALSGRETVHDLYCGTGTIALVLAAGAARVVGFEQVPAAVADARRNAAANGLAHVEFVEGDVLAALEAQARAPAAPDVVVVDPPRAGLHPAVLPRLLELGARRVVWVSCNLRAALDDLAALAAAGYAPLRARPVDLFPHTPHVECVLTFERGGTA